MSERMVEMGAKPSQNFNSLNAYANRKEPLAAHLCSEIGRIIVHFFAD